MTYRESLEKRHVYDFREGEITLRMLVQGRREGYPRGALPRVGFEVAMGIAFGSE